MVNSGNTLSLEQYLSQFRIDKSDKTTKYTHTGMLLPRGSFHVPDEEVDTFMDLYKQSVFDNGKRCGLIEQHLHDRPNTPIFFKPFFLIELAINLLIPSSVFIVSLSKDNWFKLLT